MTDTELDDMTPDPSGLPLPDAVEGYLIDEALVARAPRFSPGHMAAGYLRDAVENTPVDTGDEEADSGAWSEYDDRVAAARRWVERTQGGPR